MPTLVQRVQQESVPEVLDQFLPDSVKDAVPNWTLKVDLRSGVDLPLNAISSHRLPSCFVEMLWSDSLDYDEYSAHKKVSDTKPDSAHPVWNQQMVIRNFE